MLTAVLASIPSPSSGEIKLGPLQLRAYGLMIALGVLAAVWLAGRRLEARGVGTREDMSYVALWAVPAGVIGSRLYHVATDWRRYEGHWLDAFKIWEGGLGIWGGIGLGVVVGIWAAMRRGIPLQGGLSAITPALPLAQAIGRWGNWWNQELFGRPTDLPWALEVSPGKAVAAGYPAGTTFHPTFLYESLWCLFLCGALIWIDKRFKPKGTELFAMYVAGYTFMRFWIERLRVDPATILWGWRINEVVSLVVCGLAILYLIYSMTRRHDDPVEVQEVAVSEPISPADVAHVRRAWPAWSSPPPRSTATPSSSARSSSTSTTSTSSTSPTWCPCTSPSRSRTCSATTWSDVRRSTATRCSPPPPRPRAGASASRRSWARRRDPAGRHHRRADDRRRHRGGRPLGRDLGCGRRRVAPGAVAAREADIHAFNLVLADEARAAAVALDERIARGEDPGPLAGVPIALKDNLCTRGIATTCSSRILEGWRPPYDATVVQRLAAVGAVIVGKTNLDEFAMGSSTENSAFGPTRTRTTSARVPGGSSGGSAAAVAAGFAAGAFGSDTGGSIRQPAALCGVVGVKPTYGVVSRYGLIAFASSLDQIGPLAHTVEDAAVLLEVIAGHDPLDSTSVPQPAPRPPGDVAGRRGGPARRPHHGPPAGADPEVTDRLEAAFSSLERAGAKVVDVTVPAFGYGLTAYYLIAPAEASSNLARYDGVRYGLRVDAADTAAMNAATCVAGFGAEVKRRIMLGTYALSAGYYDAYYGKALKVRRLIADDFARAYEDADVLLTPTTPSVAFPLGDKTENPLAMYLCDVYTMPSPLAGHPAMSVPFGTGEGGLPIGLQVLAPALQEPLMYRVAAVLEAAAEEDV